MLVFFKNYICFTLPCRGIGPFPGALTNCCPSVLDTHASVTKQYNLELAKAGEAVR